MTDDLLARLEELEDKYETMRLATLEWGKDVDRVKRWSDQHLQRIQGLEAAVGIRSAPESLLVELVADAIAAQATSAGIVNDRAARRPKPPSLKERALLQLNTLNADLAMHGRGCDLSQIRRALEQLDD